jgi:hypothetical protein
MRLVWSHDEVLIRIDCHLAVLDVTARGQSLLPDLMVALVGCVADMLKMTTVPLFCSEFR